MKGQSITVKMKIKKDFKELIRATLLGPLQSTITLLLLNKLALLPWGRWGGSS